eukprot:SAG22_NODE_19_length_32182_cov_39.206963_21_plen_72_part_00
MCYFYHFSFGNAVDTMVLIRSDLARWRDDCSVVGKTTGDMLQMLDTGQAHRWQLQYVQIYSREYRPWAGTR